MLRRSQLASRLSKKNLATTTTDLDLCDLARESERVGYNKSLGALK